MPIMPLVESALPLDLHLQKGLVEIVDPATLRARGTLGGLTDRELLVTRGSFGAWDSDGRVVPETMRQRTVTGFMPDSVSDQCPATEVVATSEEEVVWGGFMARHYGHFLMESVARLWAVLPGAQLHGRRIVFSSMHDLGYAVDWLTAAGVQMVKLPAVGAVQFSRIAIPEPALRIAAWAAPEMRDIHLHVRHNMTIEDIPQQDVLWFSRSKLEPDQTAYDELLFEWLLRDHLRVIHPETMPLAEQLAALEGARLVVGVLGSAFHTLLMVDSVPDYVVLCGRTVPSAYVCQDALLKGKGKFLQSLAQARMQERKGLRFPTGMRLLIPETIRALGELSVGALSEDARIEAVVRPSRLWSILGSHSEERGIMTAVAGVLLDPHSISARMRLGSFFEDCELHELALEQFRCVADLAEGFIPAPLRAARLLARNGQHERASLFAERVLAMEPTASESAVASKYLAPRSE
jgi:hypothetical protein